MAPICTHADGAAGKRENPPRKRKRRVCQGLVADYRGRKSNGGKYDLGIGDSKSRGGTALPCGEGKAREN